MSFVVYKSSAGSGKTFTLVREYLALVLPDPGNFRHVLAITFTNKAANEMKERVLRNLRELARPGHERDPRVTRDLLPSLMEKTSLKEPEVSLKAAEALKLILHNYSDFAIGTIDGFSHRIIRTFAHDFGLPVSFDIELDSDELIETAVTLLLDRVGDDPELTTLLVRFIGTKMDEERSSDVERILNEFARILLNEEGMDRIERLKGLSLADFSRITDEVFSRIRTFENLIITAAQEAMELIRKNDIPPGAFYQGDKGLAGYFDKLARGQFEKFKTDSYAIKTVTEDNWTSGKVSASEKERIHSIKDQLASFFHRINDEKERNHGYYLFLKALAKTIYPLAVLHEISKTMDEFKKQNDLVHISEFNRRIASVVLSEPVPFIYERLGERFNHLLIDEFQDTSRLQWNNLLPLVDNSLASGYINLVVGDGKQAIYRWRNGDVEQFTELPFIPGSDLNPVILERQETLRRNHQSFPLKKNYRSLAEIVGFNNRFFTYLAGQYAEQLGNVYEDPVQDMDEEKKGGYVHLEFISAEDDSASYRELTLERVLDRIHESLRDGFRLCDMAVLCRKKKEGNEIARFLTTNGTRVVSSEALLLSASPEVNFLTGMMRILNEPDEPALAAELVSYLLLSGRIRDDSFSHILGRIDKKKPAESFFSLIREFYPKVEYGTLREMPLFELAEELIRDFFPDRPSDPYLLFFLEQVFSRAGKDTATVADFLEWWEMKKDNLSVIMPEGLDAVRILTIHKAKGLEFPVVILPFAHDRNDFARNWLWVDLEEGYVPGLASAMLRPEKDLLETAFSASYEEEKRKSMIDLVNVLYVAMTRAENRLYIMTQPPPARTGETQSVPLFLAGFLKEAGLWADDRTTYEFGTPEGFVPKGKKAAEETIPMSGIISGRSQDKIRIRHRAPEAWDVDDPGQSNRWGNLVHFALSKIGIASDLENVLDDLFSSGWVDENDRERLGEAVRAVIEGPETARFFAEGVQFRNEAEILLPDGRSIRPDRVILDDGSPVLLDFKTGKPHESHERQIKKYGEILETMGYRDIRKYLIYITPEVKLTEVSNG